MQKCPAYYERFIPDQLHTAMTNTELRNLLHAVEQQSYVNILKRKSCVRVKLKAQSLPRGNDKNCRFSEVSAA